MKNFAGAKFHLAPASSFIPVGCPLPDLTSLAPPGNQNSGWLGCHFSHLDGRLQTVTYHADEAGYVADVQYSGAAIVPAYAPAPKPAYVQNWFLLVNVYLNLYGC